MRKLSQAWDPKSKSRSFDEKVGWKSFEVMCSHVQSRWMWLRISRVEDT